MWSAGTELAATETAISGAGLQSSGPGPHYLQLKRSPETHLSMLKLDVVFWAVFLDSSKQRQILRGI